MVLAVSTVSLLSETSHLIGRPSALQLRAWACLNQPSPYKIEFLIIPSNKALEDLRCNSARKIQGLFFTIQTLFKIISAV